MNGNFATTRTLCLLNENAQCNPIWVSRPHGLRLVHFQTFHEELSGPEQTPVDTAYERCERLCLHAGSLQA
jgi:hypothetical protein